MIPGTEVNIVDLDSLCQLYIFNIKENSEKLQNYIENYLVTICEGDSGSCVANVKKELVNFFESGGKLYKKRI